MGFGSRREGRNFLVPDMHPLDLALAANGIGNAVEAVADNAVYALDTGGGEDFRKLISYGFCHLRLLEVSVTRTAASLARCDGGVARWRVDGLGTPSHFGRVPHNLAVSLCSSGRVNYC